MKPSRGTASNIIQWVAALGIGCLAVAILLDAATVSEGIRQGLQISAGVLVPSLFPFMVLSGFVSLTDYGRILSLPLRPVTERLFRLPGELGSVILLSMIGGYPVGARMISSLLQQGRIDRKTAERMLCVCVNAGPSFLITAVGAGMFLDRRAGMILFATQIAASVLVGFLTSRRAERPVRKEGGVKTVTSPSAAFVLSVTSASTAIIHLCAFAVLFAGLLSLARESGVTAWAAGLLEVEQALPDALLAGLLEVTSGCLGAAKLGGSLGFGLASVFLSFGGVSVIFQVVSFFKDTPISVAPFLRSRLLHGLLSTAMAVPLHRLFCSAAPAWAAANPPHMLTDNRTILVSLCLLGMCTVVALSAAGRRRR